MNSRGLSVVICNRGWPGKSYMSAFLLRYYLDYDFGSLADLYEMHKLFIHDRRTAYVTMQNHF